MKKLISTIMTISIFLTITYGQTKCDVKYFYKAIEAAEYILVPTKLDEGKYKLSVARKAFNLYKVEGQPIYSETRYCYEYATGDDVILIVESNYSYNKGEIIFID